MNNSKKLTCLYWNIRSNKISTVEKIFEMSNPDIIFLAEVESPAGKIVTPFLKEKGYECMKWVGDCSYKGLALYTKKEMVASSYSGGDGQYSIATRVDCKDVCIVGVWTKPPAYKYCQQALEIFNYYTGEENHPIFVGDFNISPKVCGQEKKAASLFQHISENGYASVYHYKKNLNVGEEVDVTHLHTSGKYFMLDYLIASSSSVDSIRLVTDFSNAKDFLQLDFSDHIPLIFEV